MTNPDVIVGVDGDADRHPLIPAIRQRFGVRRIDLEAWHLDFVAVLGLRVGTSFENALTDAERDQQRTSVQR